MRSVSIVVGIIVAGVLWGCATGSPRVSSPAPDSPPSAAMNPSSEVLDTIVDGSRVYLDTEVDRPALAIFDSAPPKYPAELKLVGIPGHVEVRMVVDTSGSVEVGTIHIILSNHPAFTAAVREELPKQRFLPAERGGRRVRMWAQMAFDFKTAPP